LLALIVLQFIVMKNKNRFSSAWGSSKRIILIEEKTLSATEKLRIISIDSNQFLIISNKGKKSSLMPLGQLQQKPSPKHNKEIMKISTKEGTAPMRQLPSSTKNPTKTKAQSEKNLSGHQLSKAIQAAREMNPAVSYKS